MRVCACALAARARPLQRDQARKARGELVDAWFNTATRRWEKPPAWMFKDPMLSAGIHLKPPGMVNEASSAKHKKRKQARTLDGSPVGDAYRAREQGMR